MAACRARNQNATAHILVSLSNRLPPLFAETFHVSVCDLTVNENYPMTERIASWRQEEQAQRYDQHETPLSMHPPHFDPPISIISSFELTTPPCQQPNAKQQHHQPSPFIPTLVMTTHHSTSTHLLLMQSTLLGANGPTTPVFNLLKALFVISHSTHSNASSRPKNDAVLKLSSETFLQRRAHQLIP